jgi:hypothetical protein
METSEKVINDEYNNDTLDTLTIIIGITIGFVLIIVGMHMVMYDEEAEYLRVIGTITQAKYERISTSYDDKGNEQIINKYNIFVTYMINNIAYAKKLFVNGKTQYVKDNTIDLLVHKNDYTNVQLAYTRKSSFGIIFVISSLVIIGLVYLTYYLTYNYKMYAASQKEKETKTYSQ